MSKARKKSRRRSRATQAKDRAARQRLDPEALRRQLLADEIGTIYKDAPLRIGLCYPNPYHTAMSSLGYQVIYRLMNERPTISAERVVLPDDVPTWEKRQLAPTSLESGRPISAFDLLAFSIAYDLDITGFFDLLSLGGIPILRSERGPHHPPILLGGPITASNVLPFAPFVDLAVIGDGEHAVARLLDAVEVATDREALLEAAAEIPGVWVPALHGDRVPAVQKVSGPDAVPAVAQIVTPHTELSSMFLIEGSRGCPRFCKFCLVRNRESPMREAEVERVLSAIPDWAPRVGFVGAAISEWVGIKDALREIVVERKKGVGISSLRADRLDEEFVDLLARGGYRQMTIASDAASQRLRGKMAKGLRTRHLIGAARMAKAAGMKRLKVYVIVGLPDERREDLDELVDFCRELSGILPVALGVSPLVPKLHTPLGDAPFAGIGPVDKTLKYLKRALGGVAEVRSTSARWAWVEYRLSQGAEDAGLAAYAAWQDGFGFRAIESAMAEVRERGALEAAQRHALWEAAGMR